ncbi:MAG TPA: ABC transporter substrate-binding protein [Candidatus Binatia bacterium]|jgi:NitT/TauT family transport system substrate-binding protein
MRSFSLLLFLCLASAAPAGAEKLRISYASVSGNTAIVTYVTERAGLFKKYNLDTEIILITGGPAAVSALINGDVDLDLRAPIAALQAMAHGVKLTFLVSQSNTLDYDVVTRPEIKDVKQLKGKRVGIIRFGGISELMVRYLFQRLGLDPDKDIQIIQVGQARLISLEKGGIEATVLSSGESYYARRMGFRVLNMPTLPFFGSAIVASPTWVAKKPDTVQRFLKAYIEGARFFLREKAKSLAYLKDFLRLTDAEALEVTYKTHPQHQMGLRPVADMAAAKATIDIMAARDPLVGKLKPDEIFTLQPLADLEKSGFIKQLEATH